MTRARYNGTYCGVISIDTARKYFFLGHLNNLEVAAIDLGNAYRYDFTKENIYPWQDLSLVNGKDR